MQIPEFTVVGFLTVYVVQGFVFASFVTIAYKILKRSKKNPNFVLSSFFISAAIGLFINFIYCLLIDELVVLILYYLTLFFIFLSPIFFLIFNLLMLKSHNIITKKKQVLITLFYGSIISGMIFVPDGVLINESTGWVPIWNIYLFIYIIIIVSAFAIGPGLYYSAILYQKFKSSELRKRWNCYLVGICFLYFLMYTIMCANWLNHPLLRNIIGLFGVIFSIIGGCLVYVGIGRILK